jgi:GlcNAc-PI de-N-acetylase
MRNPRLTAVLAHPDDESLGVGGTLAKYASEGVDVFLLTATRGDSGHFRGSEVPKAVGQRARSQGRGPRTRTRARGAAVRFGRNAPMLRFLGRIREGLKSVSRVELYPGCQPPHSTMLVVLDPGHPKPQVFVTPGQLLANRRLPKNNSNILIAGQTWMQFLFNIPWSDGDNIMRLGTGLSNGPNLLKQIFLSKEVLRC